MPRIAFVAGELFLFLIGCAAPPRPPELVTLEKLRADPIVSQTNHRAFDLFTAADDLLARAESEWDRGYRKLARRDALAGQVKLKTALALMSIERSQMRAAALDAEIAVAQDEERRLDEDLATAAEEVAMLQRLRAATAAIAEERKSFASQMDAAKKQSASERQRLADQLAAEKRRADTVDAIRQAEMALRGAETVDAPRTAKAKYGAAASMLQEAHREFDAGHWDEAMARAALAKTESGEAFTTARPLYESATAALNTRFRDRALESDASSVGGVKTRLERDGDMQRLVLSVTDVFVDDKAVPVPAFAKTLDAIRELLVKYPGYPVNVTAFASGHGKAADLDALALARANAVYWALVTRGVDARRMHIDSKSASDPDSADGGPGSISRGNNGRIELVLLYHLAE